MKLLGLVMIVVVQSWAFQAKASEALSCRAIFRTIIGNQSVERSTEMPITLRLSGVSHHSIDFEGRHFFVAEEGHTHLVQIVQPPHYTKGLVMRANPDHAGRLNLSEVDGNTLYKIECARKK